MVFQNLESHGLLKRNRTRYQERIDKNTGFCEDSRGTDYSLVDYKFKACINVEKQEGLGGDGTSMWIQILEAS
jgi:hypothetical protein